MVADFRRPRWIQQGARLLAGLLGWAAMSYSFDGVSNNLSGSFSSTYASVPVTLGAFFRIDVHPAALRALVFFGNNSGSIDDSQAIQQNSTLDQWGCFSRTTTNTSANLVVTENGYWVGLLGVFTSDTQRDLYVGTPANTAANATSRTVAGVMQFLRVAENLAAGGHFKGKLAEVAIWNKALNAGEIRDYLYGIKASTIGYQNLIGYWPLSAANASQANEGLDAGGALAVTGAVFDADQPNITLRTPMHFPRRVHLSA